MRKENYKGPDLTEFAKSAKVGSCGLWVVRNSLDVARMQQAAGSRLKRYGATSCAYRSGPWVAGDKLRFVVSVTVIAHSKE